MAFLEEIGKRLVDAGQGVAQKTQNFTDVTRLNSTISEKEKQISRLYTVIGEKYYAQNRENPGDDYRELVQEIDSLQLQICKCQDEVRQIKGINQCPGCGADVALTSAFCNACGMKLEHRVPVPSFVGIGRICPGCQSAVGEDNIFCIHCGTKLE